MHGNVHGEAERRQGDRQNGEEDHVAAALEDPPNQRQHLGRMLSTVVRLQASGAILISIAVLLQRRQFLRLREGKVGEVLAVLPEHDRLLVVHHRASPPVRRPPLLGGHIGAGAVVVLHRWLVGGGEVFNQAETTPNQRESFGCCCCCLAKPKDWQRSTGQLSHSPSCQLTGCATRCFTQCPRRSIEEEEEEQLRQVQQGANQTVSAFCRVIVI